MDPGVGSANLNWARCFGIFQSVQWSDLRISNPGNHFDLAGFAIRRTYE